MLACLDLRRQGRPTLYRQSAQLLPLTSIHGLGSVSPQSPKDVAKRRCAECLASHCHVQAISRCSAKAAAEASQKR